MTASTILPRRTAPVVPAIAAALAGLAVLAATAAWALYSSSGQLDDDRLMRTLYPGHGSRRALLSMLGYVSIGTTAVALVVCVVLAAGRGRWSLAAGAGAVVAGANVTTQVLKEALERPDLGVFASNSLPSGHTTVVASVVLAAVLVVPAALRAATAFVGTFAVLMTGASTVVAGWHRPSDIVAALAVSLLWAGAVTAVVGRDADRGGATFAPALAGAAAGGVLLAVLGVRPLDGWTGLPEAAALLGVLAACSALTVTAVGVVLGRH